MLNLVFNLPVGFAHCIRRYISYLGVGSFEDFRHTEATHCTYGVKSTLTHQISPPAFSYNAPISTLLMTFASKVMK